MKNIKQPSAFSNVFQIAPHVPKTEPVFPHLDLRSSIVENNVVDTTPSFSNHDYEFTPFLLWPSFPFDPTYAPVTKYAFQQYVSFRNPRTAVWKAASRLSDFAFSQKRVFQSWMDKQAA